MRRQMVTTMYNNKSYVCGTSHDTLVHHNFIITLKRLTHLTNSPDHKKSQSSLKPFTIHTKVINIIHLKIMYHPHFFQTWHKCQPYIGHSKIAIKDGVAMLVFTLYACNSVRKFSMKPKSSKPGISTNTAAQRIHQSTLGRM